MMLHDVVRSATAFAVLFICTLSSGSPITRMDVFDAADNHLLFVTFNYDEAGVCIGRDVFASDSTFLRSVAIKSGGTTAATKETSIDYEGNPLFVSTINPPSGGATSFSTVDQFGMSQYGTALSYTESTPNMFTVTQSSALLCKEQYEYNSNNELSKISVSDKSGASAWYATITYQSVAVTHDKLRKNTGSVHLTSHRGRILINLDLLNAGFVRAELITPAGRRARVLLDKQIASGSHSFTSEDALLGNGTYIVKVTLNGTAVTTRKVVVQR